MGTKGRQQHKWTEQDQETMLLNPDLTSERLAEIIGCATSCVATHRLRYKAIRDEQDRLAAKFRNDQSIHAGLPAGKIAAPVKQVDLLPGKVEPPVPAVQFMVLSDKVKDLLTGLARDNNRVLEDMQVVLDALVEIRLKCRSIGAQVKMIEDNLGLNKKN